MTDIRDVYNKKCNMDQLMALSDMFAEAKVPHECYLEPEMGGGTIKVPSHEAWANNRKRAASIILHRHSYGGEEGLLEVWVQPGMKDPQGWLTAKEAFDLVMDKMGGYL